MNWDKYPNMEYMHVNSMGCVCVCVCVCIEMLENNRIWD